MDSSTVANVSALGLVRPQQRSPAIAVHGATPPVEVPLGYVGDVYLPGTGRRVWWTGRVAIGWCYTPEHCIDPLAESAIWVQALLLHAPMPIVERRAPAWKDLLALAASLLAALGALRVARRGQSPVRPSVGQPRLISKSA